MCSFCNIFTNFRVKNSYVLLMNELQSEVLVNIGKIILNESNAIGINQDT